MNKNAKPRVVIFCGHPLLEEQEVVHMTVAEVEDKLGGLAMEATQSKDVVSFGGGPVVEKEFAQTPADVTYHLIPVRRHDTQGNWEPRLLPKRY